MVSLRTPWRVIPAASPTWGNDEIAHIAGRAVAGKL
jgi:hypothetical protein